MRVVQIVLAFFATFVAASILIALAMGLTVVIASRQAHEVANVLVTLYGTVLLGAMIVSPISAAVTVTLGFVLRSIVRESLPWRRRVLLSAGVGALPGLAAGMFVGGSACATLETWQSNCGLALAVGMTSFTVAGATSAILFTLLSMTRSGVANARHDA